MKDELTFLYTYRDALKHYIAQGGTRQEWIDRLPEVEKAIEELETKQANETTNP